MYRLPASGSVTVTGAASRSNTPNEYRVSRFSRITVWLVDRGELTFVFELPEAAFLHEPGEVRVGFGAAEVIDRHAHGFPVVRRHCRQPGARDEDGRRNQGCSSPHHFASH